MFKVCQFVLLYLCLAWGTAYSSLAFSQISAQTPTTPSTQGIANSTLNQAKAAKSILLLGDSLSAAHNIDRQTSWPALLQQRLAQGYGSVPAQQYRLINASISGETSSGGLRRLAPLLNQHQPQICILELGANDGLRGQSLKQMRNNLSQMIELCQQHGQVLLLGVWLPPNYGPAYTQAFKASYPQLAKQYNTALVPFFLDGVAGKAELMLSDGLHPNSQAQPQILRNVWPHLAKLLAVD